MAAPSTAYLNDGNAIRMDEEDLAAAIVNTYDALIAAYIYGSGDIKTLFYLDAIAEVQITDDAGTVISTGFIGLVIPGGFNYNHHASSRRFKGALPVYTDSGALIEDYVALNDGGLNTFGDVDEITFGEANLYYFALTGDFNTKASFYAGGIGGYQVFGRTGGITGWITIESTTLIAQATGTIYAIESSYDGYEAYVEAGYDLIYRAFHTNTEGTYYSSQKNIMIKAEPVSFKYHDTFASTAFTSGTTVTRYVSKIIIIGGILYTQPEAYDPVTAVFNYAPSGYYVVGTKWYQSNFGARIVNSGNCVAGEYPVGDPANPASPPSSTTVNWFHLELYYEDYPSSTSAATGCAKLDSEPDRYAVTTYLSGGVHYRNAFLTDLAFDGWYYDNTGFWKRMVDGTFDGIVEGYCT